MRLLLGFAISAVIFFHFTAGGGAAETSYNGRAALRQKSLLRAPADTFSLVEFWKMGVFGNGIGISGIVASDIDDDGAVEIVLSGATVTFSIDDFWHVLEYSSATLNYEMVWVSELHTVGISSIAAFDTDNDSIQYVFVGFADGDVRVYDGATLSEVGTIASGGGRINRILFGDADNDGLEEIVFCDDQDLFIYGASSLSLEHQVSYGASDFEVGNVDGDPAEEIVFASGEVIEFDGDTAIVEWTYAGGDFGYLIELSDIDSDGMEEIIAAEEWYYITAFDADIESPKWQINADLDVAALLVADVEGDGTEEIIYGDGQWGEIHCHDAVTQNQKWQIDNPEHGVTNIAASDVDGDTDLEILWGAGATSTGEDHLYVHDIPTLAREWQSDHIDGPFHAIDAGDVDSDGHIEIVIVSFESNSGYDDGVVFVFDAETHALEWKSGVDLFGGYAWTGVHDVAVGDVDDDAETEIVVATDELYDGAIYVINGTSHSIEGAYVYDEGAPIYSVEIVDIDNDGATEIVAGGGREHTGAPGVYVYVINGSTGAVEWHSISLGDYWSEIYALEVGNVDSDTALEIVATNDNIFVFDGINHQMFQSSLDQCYGLDLYDTDGDGTEEIVIGRDNGQVISMDGESHIEELVFDASADRIDGIRVYDVDQNGDPELILGTSGLLRVFGIADSGVIWESGKLGAPVGEYNSVLVGETDLDNRTEVILGTNYTVVEFDGPDYGTFVEETTWSRRSEFCLFLNSPNPARSSSSIDYVLSKPDHVRLEVYNSNGQLIATLVDSFQGTGYYSVPWDTESLTSGVYFYRLSAGDSKDTRKCVILK